MPLSLKTHGRLEKKNGKNFKIQTSRYFSFFLEAEVRFKAGKAGKTGQLSTVNLLFKIVSSAR